MKVNISNAWLSVLSDEFKKPYFERLMGFVENEYATKTIYPAREDMFKAFDMCAPNDVKVVIIGQDPYHGPGQANGLCFSVADGVPMPPSLVNIFKEIENDLKRPFPANGNLERWARQGVLLMNSVLTVRAGEAASHSKQGWELFTKAVVEKLAQRDGIVYMLWGRYAQKNRATIDESRNTVLSSVHPSPLSAYRGDGFFGHGHFSSANSYLKSIGRTPIEW